MNVFGGAYSKNTSLMQTFGAYVDIWKRR